MQTPESNIRVRHSVRHNKKHIQYNQESVEHIKIIKVNVMKVNL